MTEYKINDNDLGKDFVITKYLDGISQRAVMYIKSGYPVHLRGSAGIGKTSLAFYIARKIGKPVQLICGNEDINGENLIGGFTGMKKYYLEDNFITTVYKKKEIASKLWSDGRLLTACREGYTVIYDEFTRTPTEMNNVLLTILEEKIVDIPYSGTNEHMKVSPDFNIIFTSNPDEYAGVYNSPNALMDRMITIDMTTMDRETEKEIIIAKSGISQRNADKVIQLLDIVKKGIDNPAYISIRSGIMLAKIIHSENIRMSGSNMLLRNICKDIFNSINISLGLTDDKKRETDSIVDMAINTVFSDVAPPAATD